MKLALFTLLAICLVASSRAAEEEEYDYEEEAVAPVTPAPTKPASSRLGGLLSTRGRVNVGRKPAATAQSTTAKPVEQPVEEEVEDEEVIDENQEEEEAPTTTTEASKKIRGGVRPFRSNQDLLAALKRRRAQAGPSSQTRENTAHPATDATTPKSKSTTSSRNKSSAPTSETRSSGRSRFGSTRGKVVQEEVEETQREEVQVKAKPYRRG